jgi:hypothetical protein
LVPLKPLSADTSPEIERLQIDAWQRMSPAEKAALVSGLTRAAYDLAFAGVRSRHPEASPQEQFLQLAIVTLGRDLADRAYAGLRTAERSVSAPVDPISVAVEVAHILESLGIEHTIGGSIACAFAGEPRSTVDIDIVVALAESGVPALISALVPDFYVDEEALRRAVRNRSSANVIHHATQLKLDIFVAGGTPLDGQQLKRRREVNLGSGRVLYVHPPEDILLQKLRWYRQGGEISDRQWRDILGILRVQGERIDGAYLEANAPILGVADLLARARREASGGDRL